MTRILLLSVTVLCAALFGANSVPAQEPGSPTPEARGASATAAPLFSSDSVLEVTLEADLGTLFKDIGDKRTEHPAALRYTGTDGSPVTLPLEAKTRGRFRRSRQNCDFPPLRLDFPADSVGQTLFAGQNKLKLVAPCRAGKDEYEQFVLQEYLIYRIYNLLTEKSFRVRLAHITYVDNRGKRDPLTKYAFFIEDNDRMAERNGCRVIEVQAHPNEFDDPSTATLAMFQYLIGNTDWSISYLHNIEVLQCPDGAFAVPFDFDWAGLIAPPYATPDPKLGIHTVRERLFRGFCRPEEVFVAAAATFNHQHQTIESLLRGQPGLDDKYLQRSLEYVTEFYDIINDPKRFEREILKSCRTS